MHLALLTAATQPKYVLDQAASILHRQWGGDTQLRVQKMIEDKQNKCLIISDAIGGSVLGYAELEASSVTRNISNIQVPLKDGRILNISSHI